MPDNGREGWLIPFTEDELNAIYAAIEDVPTGDHEQAMQSVIDKITPAKVGDSTPSGAVRDDAR